MPYSTFATILARGVDNSNVTNIIKICKALGISADDLANGEITPIAPKARETREETDLFILFGEFERTLLERKTISAHGRTLTPDEVDEIMDILEIGLDVVVKKLEEKRKTNNKNHNKI